MYKMDRGDETDSIYRERMDECLLYVEDDLEDIIRVYREENLL
jgi:hypothetical protein